MSRTDTFWNCWHNRHLKLLFSSFALPNFINTLAIWISVLIWLINYLYDKSVAINIVRTGFREHKIPFLASFMLFIMIIIGGLSSADIFSGIEDIIQKLPFIIFPVVISPVILSAQEQVKNLENSFVAGTLIILVLAEVMLFHKWLNRDVSFIDLALRETYVEFTSLINLHPNLFALMLTLSTAIILIRAIQERLSLIRAIALALLIFGLWQSASRLAVIFLIAIISGITFETVKQRNFKLIVTLITISAGLLVAFLNNSAIKHRMTHVLKGNEVRLQVWTCAVEVIKNNPDIVLFGLGTTDVKPALKKCYIEKGFELPARKNLNAHNQFLEFLLGAGIIPLFLWLTLLVYFALHIKNGTMLTFFIAIVGFALVDSIFNVQKGIVIFNGFYWLLLYAKK